MPSATDFLNEPQAPPSASAFLDEEPAATRDYASEIPSGAELTQIGRENTPAWTEAPAQAVSELVGGMIPHDLPSYIKSILGPVGTAYEQGKGLAQGDVSSIPFVGRVPEIMQAEETPAGSKERYLAAMKTLMDVGLLAGAGGERAPSPLRTEPTLAERITQPRVEPAAPEVPQEPLAPVAPETPPAPEAAPPVAPEAPPPPVTPAVGTVEAQILARRQGILDRKKELEARAANGEQGLEPHMAAVDADLMDPNNPVVHAPPVESPVEPLIFGHTFDQIKSAQQGGRLADAIRGSPVKPRATEADYALLEQHGLEGLQKRKSFGVLDRLGLPMEPSEGPVQAQEAPPLASEAPGGVQGAEAAEPSPPGASFAKATGGKTPLAPVPADMINAVRLPSGKIVGHNIEHGDVLSRYSEQYEPGEMTSGWVLKRPTRAETDATFIGTDDVQRHAGDFDTAFKEKSPPPDYTPEAAAARAAQPPETGISKAAIAGQREARELPAIERQKQIDFGESLDRAKATLAQDPMAGQRLVEELSAKPRAVNPEDTPLLIERMQQVQREFDAANRAVNEAAPEQLEVAKARLEHARTEYDKTVTATQNATSTTGAGLNSVKMILKEDYSLARMESRKRAANNGSISPEQKIHTDALHASIAELSDRLDRLEKQRSAGFRVGDVGKEAAAARKSGKRLTDYTGEAAKKARERISRQLHGLGAKPAPPTLLYDYAVVGADHLARGLTKFSDWSAQMIKEFGEKVKPHLQDLWKMARAVHDKTAKAFRTPEEVRLERYKTGLAKQTVGVTAKIQRGDFTKAQRQPMALDTAAYKMKGNLQRLKNEFERGVAKDAYNKMSPADKFWQHFVGVERAMKLSSPAVFEKLGLAAAVREVLAPVEAAGGYGVATFFPRLAKGTRYGGDLRTIARAEIKAKAALFTEGMKDSWENLKGKETTIEAMSDKYGRRPDFWYNRIGKIHAAVKAPIKRAEFVRSLETRMDAAVKAGEDINHPEVMDRLATESALDANRAIFQQNTVVSKFFSMADRLHPAAGRTARFLFPVVRIPVNLFKEFVTYNVGAPVAAAKIGRAYWKGVETLEPAAREAIIRQLVKGSAGGAAILWGYYNNERVHDFFSSMPPWFEHTPIAMAIHEGSIIKGLEEQGTGTYYRPTEAFKNATKMAKFDIPFMYTAKGLVDALDARDPNGWRDYLYGMIQSSVVPQAVSWTAKEMDKPTPFSIFDKPTYRQPTNIGEAITQGIPGLRQDIPEYHSKKRGH